MNASISISVKSIKLEYATWIYNIFREDFPDPKTESELWHFVKTYQIQRHSKTTRKYRNQRLRFHFGKCFTSQIIVAEPFPNKMQDDLKEEIMEKRTNVLRNVKNYTDTVLNPSKKFSMIRKEVTFKNSMVSKKYLIHFKSYNLTEYDAALPISDVNDFQVHLKRLPSSCFINNYFAEELLAWEAN